MNKWRFIMINTQEARYVCDVTVYHNIARADWISATTYAVITIGYSFVQCMLSITAFRYNQKALGKTIRK